MADFKVLLVKPAKTNFDSAGLVSGWSKNARVNEEGYRGAERLAARMNSIMPKVSRIYSSDLGPSQQTARIIANVYNFSADECDRANRLSITVDARLRDMGMGELQGVHCNSKEYIRYKRELIYGLNTAEKYGTEKMEEVLGTMRQFFERLKNGPGGNMIAVGGEESNAIFAASLSLPEFKMWQYVEKRHSLLQKNGTINVIEWDGKELRLESVVEAGLEKPALSMRDLRKKYPPAGIGI